MKQSISLKLRLIWGYILLSVCLGMSSCKKEASVALETRNGEIDLSLFAFKQIGKYRGTNIPSESITLSGITNYQYIIDEKSLSVICPNETVSNIYTIFHSHLGEADMIETNTQGEIDSFIYIPVGDTAINCRNSSSTNGIKEVLFVITKPKPLDDTILSQKTHKGKLFHPKEQKGKEDLSLFVFKQIGKYRGTNIPSTNIVPSGITDYLYVKDEKGFQVLCPNETVSNIYKMFQPSFGEPVLLKTNSQGKIDFFVYGRPGDIAINCSDWENDPHASQGVHFVVLKPGALNE
jgi:hypothetical protein